MHTDRVTVADILRRETVGGVLLLVAAAAALVWANLAPGAYVAAQQTQIGPLDLQHWASDGLLAIFFFVAGLELRREFSTGSLADPRRAVLPIVAAVAGMVVPALVYLIVNAVHPSGDLSGWAIPMATDIAFALAVLAVAGRGLPVELRAFLLTLAIVDDLGAIAVIAVVFTGGIAWGWLAAAAAAAGLWALLQHRRVERWYVYLPLAPVTWWCLHESGVHATIAGVALGLLTRSGGSSPGPNERWEHLWRPVSAGFAVPVFALFAAGVTLEPAIVRSLVTAPIPLGIALGLVLGKAIGILGGAWLTARFSRATLAPGLGWRDVAAVGVLGGVGFTVSLLIADLTFATDPTTADEAKAAVLTGSLVAALLAAVLLRRRSRVRGPSPEPRPSH